MRMLNIIISSIFSLFLSATAQAKMDEKMIACPSVDVIHRIAPLMGKADRSNGAYDVEIPVYRDNGLSWHIISVGIIAHSSEEAVVIAQNRCASVSHMVYPFARKFEKSDYVCFYYDRTLPNPFVSIYLFQNNYLTQRKNSDN